MKENETIGAFVAKNRERTLAYLKKRFSKLSCEDTEDVYQEASIVLFYKQCKGTLDSLTCELYTYFLSICTNLCMKMIYGKQRMLMVNIDDGQGNVSTAMLESQLHANSSSMEFTEQKCQLMNVILSELPEHVSKLMVDHYIKGRNWTDIAHTYGLANANSAKSLVCRFRRRIERKYNKILNGIFG